MTEPTALNAAQISNLERQCKLMLEQKIRQMELRQWAMEKALSNRGSLLAQSSEEIVAAAEKLYEFVAKPALEFKVEG